MLSRIFKLLYYNLTLKANRLFYMENSIRKIIVSDKNAYFFVPISKHFKELQPNQASEEKAVAQFMLLLRIK